MDQFAGRGVRYPDPSLPDAMPPMDVYNTSPDDKQNVWLFNIGDDPLETQDLSSRKPFLVRFLLDKLAAYNETAVPVIFPPFDPESVPAKHGGVWAPWVD